MRIALLLAVAGFTAHAAVVRGVVVENQTGKPLSRATVTLKPISGTPGGALTTRTNTYGVFDFPPVPGGAYLVSAARRNFGSIQYGQKDWKSAGAPVLMDESSSTFLNIRLPRLGVITGRVVDENDVGLPNHDVTAYRNTRPPQLVNRVTADERGIYRIFDLEPGSYLVRTVAREYEEGSYLPTFSKDSTKVENARQVEVQLDQEAGNIDVRPAPGRLFKIEGTVLPGLTDPETALPETVKLTMASDMGRETVETNGAFRFPPVAPGEFELYAEGPGNGTANCFMLGAFLTLPITDADKRISISVPCVRETPIQLMERRGRMVDATKVRIFARRKDLAGAGEAKPLPVFGSSFSGRVQLAPGRWELMAVPPAGYCVVEFGFSGQRSEGLERSRADGLE